MSPWQVTNSVQLPTKAARVGQKPAKGAQMLQMWRLDEEAEIYFKRKKPLQRACGVSRVQS